MVYAFREGCVRVDEVNESFIVRVDVALMSREVGKEFAEDMAEAHAGASSTHI
jgi:hypothetical protein